MDSRKHALMKNKAIATGLMVGAAILFVVARSQKGVGAWEWLAAFAEAAMVGALADWFAVVALFKHPLGIPVPHTAIIKNKKDAIAANLAAFIRDKFLAPESLIAKVHQQNPAGYLATYLCSDKNAAGLATGISRALTDSIGFIDDDRVQRILNATIYDRIEKFDLSSATGTLLDRLRNDNRHQQVLDEALRRFSLWLATPDVQAGLANAIEKMLTTDYPIISAFIPNREQFSRGTGDKIVRKINEYIQDVNADPAHTLRKKFDANVTEFIDRLKTDPELRAKVEGFKLEAVENPFLADYVKNLGNDLKNWLRNDLAQPCSKVQEKIAAAVSGLGNSLAHNRELQQSLNEHLEKLILKYGDNVRSAIARHIYETVKTWETDEYVTEIELSIGSDLQFIRMNGTLVGGLIGIMLHAVSLLLV